MAKADQSKNTTLKKATKTVSTKSRTQAVQKKKPAAGTTAKASRGKVSISAKPKVSGTAKPKTKKPVVSKTVVASQKRLPKKVATKTTQTVKKVVSPPKPATSDTFGRKMASSDELRNLLLERKKGILRNFGEEINSSNEAKLNETVGDMADIAQESNENEMIFHLAEVESRELAKIDTALERITEGTYGVCEKCGEKISLARLKALPFAVKCIRCQEEDEQELW